MQSLIFADLKKDNSLKNLKFTHDPKQINQYEVIVNDMIKRTVNFSITLAANKMIKHYFEILSRQSVNGNYYASYELGRLYFYGIGTPINKKLGLKLIRLAAEKNYKPAISKLSALHAKTKS